MKSLLKNLAYISRKIIIIIILITFFLNMVIPQTAYAQAFMPQPGTMVNLSPAYVPAIVRGIKVFPDNPLKFDFIVDKGDSGLNNEDIKEESTRLIKYFLTTLTVPEEDLWVNLSPYEKDRIVPNQFGITEMGKDLLAQDYLLKQITSSLMYPEKELGQEFWDKVYEKAFKEYGTTDIPVDTFNKVWIVPEKAVVYENGDTAFVAESKLKVMLEEDYVAQNEGKDVGEVEEVKNPTSTVASEVIRQIIIPAIEKEVNEGKNFATLRQIYNSMILATWYKRTLRESIFGKVYIGKNKVAGVDVEDKEIKQKIYDQYIESFKKGAYNYIKEEFDPTTQQIIPRKYFSGGVDAINIDSAMVVTSDKKFGRRFLKTISLSMMLIISSLAVDPTGALAKNLNQDNFSHAQDKETIAIMKVKKSNNSGIKFEIEKEDYSEAKSSLDRELIKAGDDIKIKVKIITDYMGTITANVNVGKEELERLGPEAIPYLLSFIDTDKLLSGFIYEVIQGYIEQASLQSKSFIKDTCLPLMLEEIPSANSRRLFDLILSVAEKNLDDAHVRKIIFDALYANSASGNYDLVWEYLVRLVVLYDDPQLADIVISELIVNQTEENLGFLAMIGKETSASDLNELILGILIEQSKNGQFESMIPYLEDMFFGKATSSLKKNIIADFIIEQYKISLDEGILFTLRDIAVEVGEGSDIFKKIYSLVSEDIATDNVDNKAFILKDIALSKIKNKTVVNNVLRILNSLIQNGYTNCNISGAYLDIALNLGDQEVILNVIIPSLTAAGKAETIADYEFSSVVDAITRIYTNSKFPEIKNRSLTSLFDFYQTINDRFSKESGDKKDTLDFELSIITNNLSDIVLKPNDLSPSYKNKIAGILLERFNKGYENIKGFESASDALLRIATSIDDPAFIESDILPFLFVSTKYYQEGMAAQPMYIDALTEILKKYQDQQTLKEKLTLFMLGMYMDSMDYEITAYLDSGIKSSKAFETVLKYLADSDPIMNQVALGVLNRILTLNRGVGQYKGSKAAQILSEHLESAILPALYNIFRADDYNVKIAGLEFFNVILDFLDDKNDPRMEAISYLAFRAWEIVSGTLSPKDIINIYRNRIFLSLTEGLIKANRFSIARSTELLCKSFDVTLTDERIELLTKFLLEVRDRYSKEVMIDEDTFLNVITHQEPGFRTDPIIELFQKFKKGEDAKKMFKEFKPHKGEDYLTFKIGIKNQIINSPENTLLWFHNHGGVNYIFLKDGVVKESQSIKGIVPFAIHYSELASWLFERAKKIHFKKYPGQPMTELDLSGFKMVGESCFNADFMWSMYTELFVLCKKEGIKVKKMFPIISGTGYGSVGYISMIPGFEKGYLLRDLFRYLDNKYFYNPDSNVVKDKLLVGDFMAAEEYLLKGPKELRDKIISLSKSAEDKMTTYTVDPTFLASLLPEESDKLLKIMGKQKEDRNEGVFGYLKEIFVQSEEQVKDEQPSPIKYREVSLPKGIFLIPKVSLANAYPVFIPAQIGNQASVVDVMNDYLNVRIHKEGVNEGRTVFVKINLVTDTILDDLNLEFPLRQSLDKEAFQYEPLLSDLLKKMKSPQRKPILKTFADKDIVEDLEGFASASHRLVVLAEGLANNKDSRIRALSYFHELGEYLGDENQPKEDKLEMSFKGNKDTGDGIIEVTVGGVPITSVNPYIKLTRKDAKEIIKNRTDDYHYLLRAVQRELFGDLDAQMTKIIKDFKNEDYTINDLNVEQQKEKKDAVNSGIDSNLKDYAMGGEKYDEQTKGGIDLNPNKLELEIKGNKVDFNLPDVSLEELEKAPGFVPIIIQITPVTNINMLLGEADLVEPEQKKG